MYFDKTCTGLRAIPRESANERNRETTGTVCGKVTPRCPALQENQMMHDRLPHGGMLPIGNAILFGGLLHNPGQRSIVSVAHKRAQMMDDMMVEPARKPTYQRVTRRIIGRCREDVIDAVVKLAAAGGKVSAVDGVRGLEYQRYRQTDDHMGQHESRSDQQRRFPQ